MNEMAGKRSEQSRDDERYASAAGQGEAGWKQIERRR